MTGWRPQKPTKQLKLANILNSATWSFDGRIEIAEVVVVGYEYLCLTEDLAKKRIRAGHRGSATRTVRQITGALEGDTPDWDRLSLLRVTLKNSR